MHTLKLMEKPCKLHKVNFAMAQDSEFIVTGSRHHSRCDLGECIIQLRPPYFVGKIRTFKTTASHAGLAERNEKERVEWLIQRQKTFEFAREAAEKGMTVKELCGDHYDEEYDEPRMVAKVPGLNVYIELFGTMGPEDVEGEKFWSDASEHQPFDRMVDAAAATALNRMSYFLRSTMARDDQKVCATKMTDWQPREDWHEEYDYNEFFQRPELRGIGFREVDADRRPAQYPKHKFSDEEKEEYSRLKEAAVDLAAREGRELTKDDLAKIAQQATANVAAAKLMK